MTTISHAKAKIVCTLGPATSDEAMLVKLIRAGMDVARFNFSHGSYDDHLRTINNLRAAMKATGEHITLLQDLQGPKIRIGEIGAPSIDLVPGNTITITTEPIVGTTARVSTTYTHLPKDVHKGDTLLLDDGKLQLRVREVVVNDVECEIVVGGKLSSHKGINLPGVALSTPSYTEKDLQDLEFGIKNCIDYVALSFVRSADDIRDLRQEMAWRMPKGQTIPIIAKIEKPQAIADIDHIIAEADGIMIARGDLGVELPPEDVPILQKMIVKRSNAAGKPVIIATQMLESMISSPTPTRAEASDVANAVMDGGDAVMLSGETSVGKYPLEAVMIMEKIIRKVEGEITARGRVFEKGRGVIENRHEALGMAACLLSEQMKSAAIVTVTNSGKTAQVLSRYRPNQQIIAVTDSASTLRRLNLVWGVSGIVFEDLSGDSDSALQRIQERLVALGLVRRGEYFVLLAGQPLLARGSTNFIKVEKVA